MKNWTDDIRQRLQGHRQAPPQELLDNIKVELQRRGLTPAHSSQTTHVGTGKLWWAAACLTAVIAGVGVWCCAIRSQRQCRSWPKSRP